MIHTALNSMHMITQNQSMNAQNLSNLNVPGYRRDLGVEFETAYLETKEGIDDDVPSFIAEYQTKKNK